MPDGTIDPTLRTALDALRAGFQPTFLRPASKQPRTSSVPSNSTTIRTQPPRATRPPRPRAVRATTATRKTTSAPAASRPSRATGAAASP